MLYNYGTVIVSGRGVVDPNRVPEAQASLKANESEKADRCVLLYASS